MRTYGEPLMTHAEIESLKDLSAFRYDKIPAKFRFGNMPEDTLTLFKGAERGRELKGFLSHAVENGKILEIEKARKIIESGDEQAIFELLDNHTSANAFSAFLSTTFNPECAQVYAPTRDGGKKYTIYQLNVSASRCVYDAFDTGKSGASGQILVLGIIHPNEISAIKINNDDLHSELLFTDRFGTKQIRRMSDSVSNTREVKSPRNWLRRF